MTEEIKTTRYVIDPAAQVSGPSIGLIITGVIGGLFSLFALIALGIGMSLGSLWSTHRIDWYEDFYGGAIGMGSSFLGLLVALFIIYAAIKMKELKQWNVAVVASVLAMVPCISPCCIIGLPIGIWALVVLMRPDVKEAFSK